MPDTKPIYWAVLLDEDSRKKLLDKFPPKHPNIYAEHMTIVFKPSKEKNEKMFSKLGKIVNLYVVGRRVDDKGDAVVICGDEDRLDDGIAHITISCADGTKPVYSNILLSRDGWDPCFLLVSGTIQFYSKKGWSNG